MPELQGAFSALSQNGILTRPIFVNLFDAGVSTATSSYSSGSANVLQLPVGPTLAKPWTVSGWSVRFNAFMMVSNSPPFGRLGKIFASLILGSGGASPAVATAYTPPPQSALANLQTLYDGNTDPPFPFLNFNQTSAPESEGIFQATFQLPQPQEIGAGERLALGLWLTPSLVASILNITVYNAQYSVTYSS